MKSSEKHKDKKHHVFKLKLILAKWKELIPFNQRNYLIAEALNYTVVNEKMKILGYLISNTNIALIIKCPENKVRHCLKYFEQQLSKELKKYLRYQYIPCWKIDEEYATGYFDHYLDPLFKTCLLKNETLVRLITGNKVFVPYYDPKLSKLESLIDSYNFCSAMDYTGAVGPVFIDKK